VGHQCPRGGRRDRLRLDLFDRAHAGTVPAGRTDHPADGPQTRRTWHLECVGVPVGLRARIPLGEGFRKQVSADERTGIPVRVYVHVADDLRVAEPFPLPIRVSEPFPFQVPVALPVGIAFPVAVALRVAVALGISVALPVSVSVSVSVNVNVHIDVDEPVAVHNLGFSRVIEHVRVALDAGAPRVRSRG
jgi:hypothetical protein